MNNVSFQGRMNLTNYVDGVKKITHFDFDENTDQLIKQTASRLFKFYTPKHYKSVKHIPEVYFRRFIGELIGKDLSKKSYFDNSIVQYTPDRVSLKELNRYTNNGIEFDIIF